MNARVETVTARETEIAEWMEATTDSAMRRSLRRLRGSTIVGRLQVTRRRRLLTIDVSTSSVVSVVLLRPILHIFLLLSTLLLLISFAAADQSSATTPAADSRQRYQLPG